MDLTGIADLIVAITGVVSLGISIYLITKVNHVIELTNSNFSNLQITLDDALKRNIELESNNPPNK